MSSEEKGQYVDSYEDVSMFALAAPAEADIPWGATDPADLPGR